MGNTLISGAFCPRGNKKPEKWDEASELTTRRTGDYEWGYSADRDGPDSWWIHYPSAGGKKQSPIDINAQVADFDSDLIECPLKLHYSQCREEKLMYNNGCTCAVRVRGGDSHITGGPFGKQKFKLVEFWFRWGENNEEGSEHTLNGLQSSAELQLVHVNEKYSSYEEAEEKEDGLVIVAVFIKCANNSNEGLEYLAQFLPDVQYKGQSTFLSPDFDLNHLLPGDVGKYWVYEGSLTAPPCHESVKWIVFKDPLKIMGDQLSVFRTLNTYEVDEESTDLDEHYGRIRKNCRPVQNLGSRNVLSAEPSFMSHKNFKCSQSMLTAFPKVNCQTKLKTVYGTSV